MQWFFAYSGNSAGWFRDMIKVAVISAKENTDLQANCLYDGDGDDVFEWLQKNGVAVHKTQVPFREELFSEKVQRDNEGTGYRPSNATGHFLRLLVPDYSDGEQSLYTDCDVMFLRQPEFPSVNVFGACGELNVEGISTNSSFNSGVMLIDNDKFSRERDSFIDFARSRSFFDRRHSSYDQVLLNEFYSGRWDILDAGMNWRPWQGCSDRASILHFHGPKPHRVRAILDGDHLSAEQGLKAYIDKAPLPYKQYVDAFYDYLNKDK